MVCENCQKNEANVHMEIMGDVRNVMHLCTECAAASGMLPAADGGLDLTAMICKLTAKALQDEPAPDVPGPEYTDAACGSCGLTAADFQQTRHLGCAECYHALAAILAPALARMHRGSGHVGKFPGASAAGGTVARESCLAVLHRKLEHAVAAEAYEVAAGLRDEITGLASSEEC